MEAGGLEHVAAFLGGVPPRRFSRVAMVYDAFIGGVPPRRFRRGRASYDGIRISYTVIGGPPPQPVGMRGFTFGENNRNTIDGRRYSMRVLAEIGARGVDGQRPVTLV